MKREPKVVLGIDQAGNKSGWAVFVDGRPFACGTINCHPRRFDGYGARFLRFEKEVGILMAEHKPDLVVFEEHRAHSAVQAAQVLGAVTAIVAKLCESSNTHYMAVPVMTLKKHATGYGMASKKLMIMSAKKRYPTMQVTDDNVADALHMAAWGAAQLS